MQSVKSVEKIKIRDSTFTFDCLQNQDLHCTFKPIIIIFNAVFLSVQTNLKFCHKCLLLMPVYGYCEDCWFMSGSWSCSSIVFDWSNFPFLNPLTTLVQSLLKKEIKTQFFVGKTVKKQKVEISYKLKLICWSIFYEWHLTY